MFGFVSEYQDRVRFIKTWLLNPYDETLLWAQHSLQWKGRLQEKGPYQATLQLFLIFNG